MRAANRRSNILTHRALRNPSERRHHELLLAAEGTAGTDPSYWACWGKLDTAAAPPTFHPLICHLIDVAAVIESLWSSVLPPALLARTAAAFGLDEGAAGRWCAYLGALHDIGKLSPGFQLKAPLAQPRLAACGFTFPHSASAHPPPHGTITARVLPGLLKECFAFHVDVAQQAATIVAATTAPFPRPSIARGCQTSMSAALPGLTCERAS